MKMNAVSIRPGNVLEHKGKLWVVAKIQHTQPGKGGAYMQVEMKDIKDGTKLNERFRSSENVERAHLDSVAHQYLYTDENNIVLMNPQTYDQVEISREVAAEQIPYLQDGMVVDVVSYQDSAIGIELPESAVFKVVETEPVVKGQTAASSNKPAQLENGLRVMVPPFIEVDDMVVVKTADGQYVERAKK